MFIRILIAIIFTSLFSSGSFAGTYCDTRPSQAERDRCHRNAVDPNKVRSVRSYNAEVTELFKIKDKIMAASHISKEDKAMVQKDHMRWSNELKRACGDTNTTCMLPGVQARVKAYEDFYNNYGK